MFGEDAGAGADNDDDDDDEHDDALDGEGGDDDDDDWDDVPQAKTVVSGVADESSRRADDHRLLAREQAARQQSFVGGSLIARQSTLLTKLIEREDAAAEADANPATRAASAEADANPATRAASASNSDARSNPSARPDEESDIGDRVDGGGARNVTITEQFQQQQQHQQPLPHSHPLPASESHAPGSMVGVAPAGERMHAVQFGIGRQALRLLRDDLSDDEEDEDGNVAGPTLRRRTSVAFGRRKSRMLPGGIPMAPASPSMSAAFPYGSHHNGLTTYLSSVSPRGPHGFSTFAAAPAALQRTTFFADFVRLSLVNRIVKTQADRLSANQLLMARFSRIRTRVLDRSSEKWMHSIQFHLFYQWRAYTRRRRYLMRKVRRILRGDEASLRDLFIAWRDQIQAEKRQRLLLEQHQSATVRAKGLVP
jgi:hypothetical protein